jgi:hypothetical protein
MLAAVIDRHDLADDLAGPIREARVERIRDHQRRSLVGRHARRQLIDFRTRGEHQRADALALTGVDDVDDTLHADVEHQIGRPVEDGSAVDVGEVMHLLDAAHRGVDRGGIADIALDEFELALEAIEAAQRTS